MILEQVVRRVRAAGRDDPEPGPSFRPRSVRIIAALVLVATAVGISASPASAYHLLGGRWSLPNPLYYHSYSTGSDSTAWTSGAVGWNNTPTPVLYVSVRADAESIGMYSTNNSSVSWDGLTVLHPSPTSNPYSYASAYLNDYYTNGYSAAKRLSVSAHELGHVLGLAHTSGAVLMNAFTCGVSSRWCTYSINSPRQDDINGVNAIY